MGKYEVESLSHRKHRHGILANFLSAIAMIVVIGILMVTSTLDIVSASQKEVNQLEGFVMGEVTDRRDNVIRIDSREYPFFADVIVKDQNLTPRALKDIVTGTQVMFHLKQGRIDQIIILLPS